MDNERQLVLIVDDNSQNLQFLGYILEESGYEPALCRDGKMALNFLKKEKPDLILLDIMMPGMDGIETCRRIKQIDETKDIPILFITALAGTSDKLKAFNVGGVDYITKPFQKEEVLARVNAHLTIRNQRKELEGKNAKLQHANATRDRFFSIISHDLRQPFSGINGFAQILIEFAETLSKDEIRKIGHSLSSASTSTFKLLENLLEWTSLQRGKMEYQPVYLNFFDIVSSSINLYEGIARQKGIDITAQIEPNTILFADRNMIDTVLRNLINNAIKFTSEGGKVIVSSHFGDTTVEARVADTGVGISDRGQKRIFKLDQKYKTDGTAGESGSGLGLILCQELIEKNGGKIWVESEKGKGSIFKFTLPRDNSKSLNNINNRKVENNE